MSKKIFFGVVSVSLVIMLICAVLVMGILYDYMGQKLDEQLTDEAVLVEEAWLAGGQDYLNKLETREDVESRITLLSVDGEVLYDSSYDTHKMENHMQRDEVKEALEKGEGFATRISYTLEQDMRYYAKMTADDKIIRISMSHNSHMRLLLDMAGMLIFVLTTLLLLSAAISYRIARAVVKPINDIDLDRPELAAVYDELQPLLYRISVQNEKIKNQMEYLRKSREEFNIITENMNEGLLIIDKASEILTYNAGALRMLGVTSLKETDDNGQLRSEAEKIEGSVLKLNRSMQFRKAVSEALSGQNSRAIIEGNGFVCEVIAGPVKDGGEISGAVLILIDVTERECGERMRREFTSNVSHELKTPLTSIYGVSDMLATGIVKAEDVKGFAKTIKEESGRLITLIDDILRLSRLDENTMLSDMETADVWEITQQVTERLRGKAEAKGIRLEAVCEGEKSSTKIKGADYIVDEIIFNLCENAIKYNKPGGSVNVTVGFADDKCILSVSDTGIGIPKAEQERVFERFYRVDKSHSKKIGGTGLGLSIVKHGVSHLGGKITLESEEGKGTTITLVL